MTVNNGEYRDKNGKFLKGNDIAKKKRSRTQTDKLLAALRKAGKKQNKDFWDIVATKAFVNKEIMKAIINKLVPTINELTGEGGSPILITLKEIIYQDDEKKDAQD